MHILQNIHVVIFFIFLFFIFFILFIYFFFHSYLRENNFKIKRNLKWSESARINLPTLKKEWLFNSELPSLKESGMSKIQALQTVFSRPLSLPFWCVVHLWFESYRRHVVYNDATRDSVTCSFTLHDSTENHHVKCQCPFFFFIYWALNKIV